MQEFEALYAIKMQNWLKGKSPELQACLKGVTAMINECRTGPWGEMVQYSAHALNDLGNQPSCEQLNKISSSLQANSTYLNEYMFSNSTYIVMSLNVSTTPVSLRQGLCLPQECTQGMYMHFGTKASSFITNLFQSIIKKFSIDVYIAPPDVGVELSFVNPKLAIGQKSAYLSQIGDQEMVGINAP